jgi:hypothetical protein
MIQPWPVIKTPSANRVSAAFIIATPGARRHSRHRELTDHLFDERSQNRCVSPMVFAPTNPFVMPYPRLLASFHLASSRLRQAWTTAAMNTLR